MISINADLFEELLDYFNDCPYEGGQELYSQLEAARASGEVWTVLSGSATRGFKPQGLFGSEADAIAWAGLTFERCEPWEAVRINHIER